MSANIARMLPATSTRARARDAAPPHVAAAVGTCRGPLVTWATLERPRASDLKLSESCPSARPRKFTHTAASSAILGLDESH